MPRAAQAILLKPGVLTDDERMTCSGTRSSLCDALTTARVYRSAMPADAACAELQREAQRGWRSAGPLAFA